MSDKIVMRIDSEEISSFLAYKVEADIYKAAGAFAMELDPTTRSSCAPGKQCTLEVNGTRVLTGVIDKILRSYGKDSRRLTICGRDVLALAVDAYCTSFITLSNKTLVQVADQLIRGLPYIERSKIIYAPEAFSLKNSQAQVQIEPGSTVFDILRDMARNRGLCFFCLADGTLVFDRPKSRVKVKYSIRVKDGKNHSGVLEGSLSEDVSKLYSKIVVIGQRQDTDFSSPSQVNVKATATVDNAPLPKSFVAVHNGDGITPGQLARAIKEQQAAAARKIEYTLSGHTQNGVPWQIDELVYVWDDDLGIAGETLLVVARSFEFTKSRGPVTKITLGPPGVVQ